MVWRPRNCEEHSTWGWWPGWALKDTCPARKGLASAPRLQSGRHSQVCPREAGWLWLKTRKGFLATETLRTKTGRAPSWEHMLKQRSSDHFLE